MKKMIMLLIGITILGLAFFGVKETLAQEPTPPGSPANPTGQGPRGQGMRRLEQGKGFLKPYMATALISEFGLTKEELDALHEDGDETLWDYAQSIGLTWEAFHEKLEDARQSALEEAVLDGVISQEQADWMIDRMQHMRGRMDSPEQRPCEEGINKSRQSGRGRREGRGGGRW